MSVPKSLFFLVNTWGENSHLYWDNNDPFFESKEMAENYIQEEIVEGFQKYYTVIEYTKKEN